MMTSLRKLATVVGAAAILATASASYAGPMLNGSLALGGLGVSQNGANLAVSTTISAAETNVTSPGLGDYSPVGIFNPFPFLTLFGPHTLDLSSLPALAAGFSISNATFGSFAATSASIVQQTANFLDIFIVGTFTPAAGGPLAGFDPTPTSLRISINQSGSSLSEAITLNSPPVPVPEPASLSLLGIGLAGAAMALRRKRQ